MNSSLSDYLSLEWQLFEKDSSRQASLLEAVKGIQLQRVLDIGCGAGQEMLPFVRNGARGFGIDISADAARVSKDSFRRAGLAEKFEFVSASGTHIPFEDDFFDLVICRVALMYMDNRAAFAEISRVLKRQGRFLLKYHSPAYYWEKFRSGARAGQIRSAVHATRVLAGGYYYFITGRQSFNFLSAGGEIFQTEQTLRKEFAALNLRIISKLPDTNPLSPSVLVVKG